MKVYFICSLLVKLSPSKLMDHLMGKYFKIEGKSLVFGHLKPSHLPMGKIKCEEKDVKVFNSESWKLGVVLILFILVIDWFHKFGAQIS